MKVNNKANYVERRKKEYPPVEEQLDSIWKGGTAFQTMQNEILNIKAKYPKKP